MLKKLKRYFVDTNDPMLRCKCFVHSGQFYIFLTNLIILHYITYIYIKSNYDENDKIGFNLYYELS